jgi:hypothetical protein
MNRIDQSVIDRAYNYAAYREMIDQLLAEGKTTGQNHSEAMLHYTKMNATRMKRLDKKTVLQENVIDQIQKWDRPMIWLVLTEAWCGDAAQVIPVLEKMTQYNEKVDMKLIFRDEYLDIMDAFLTDGGRSIPKLILLDAATLDVLGSWGPRPKVAQGLMGEVKAEMSEMTDAEAKKERYLKWLEDLQLWYIKDKTISVQREVTDAVEQMISAGITNA